MPDMSKDSKHSSKWFWMMNYCKKNGLPPAQKWAWDKAEKAWAEACSS